MAAPPKPSTSTPTPTTCAPPWNCSPWPRTVIVIGEPPFGWKPGIAAAAANVELARYNDRARTTAAACGAGYIDLWEPFHYAAAALGWSITNPTPPADDTSSLWSDGVHLAELGAPRTAVDDHLTSQRTIQQLLTLAPLERTLAPAAYADVLPRR
ncbi:hypothetical protein [Nocardia harenae]|uniref:hypothetical protein n=1 Tax=Nocardia harenae TaxID=358707 RepID=UPI0008331CCD|nr:hypothetical protein [Nocardia harenae]